MPNNPGGGKLESISVSTIYGHGTRKAIVQIELKGKQIQMEVEEARALALNIFQAAEAALTDAFLSLNLSRG